MGPKKEIPTNDELLAQLDDLGLDSATPSKAASKPKPAAAPGNSDDIDAITNIDDIIPKQRPASRAGTPRVSTTEPRAATSSPKPNSGRTSEEKSSNARRSQDLKQSSQPSTDNQTGKSAPAEQAAKITGGGWWGGILSTATAAMKQAEAAVKEIQNNEEALKWAEQVRGNVGVLRDLGGELRTLALPTFTSLIHTLAPPISSHERLQIHITHDFSGYPSLDPLIYAVFSRVMSQVEGGDLLVIQRGQESSPRRGSDLGIQGSTAGWRDGPWWRTVTPNNPRSISAVRGGIEATKLARASAEAYATEYYSPRGGVEEAAKQATEVLSDSNPVRNSDIFLAIQALSQTSSKDLFQAGPTGEKSSPPGAVEAAGTEDEEVAFAIYLHDPVHGIALHTVSQAVPQRWIDWLDAPAPNDDSMDANVARVSVPESIAEIIESGGVDPREWVAEWIEDSLTLSVGVVAQRYVARRMGVGEGGINKGKMRAEKATTVDSGAGEAARAI